ncbi:hypothetical protein [uncultured Fluviicola sp.]|uniref:hypothetical protein n=1 Tax=uncultured Fluviicola sp. TaxID=463303 RepID=UPI0025E616FE|nr:hypothetical protein [uncultured Fluviicola sp.]
MKIIVTLLGIICSAAVFSQNASETVIGEERLVIRGEENSGNASEAVAIINAIRTEVRTSNQKTGQKRGFTETDYKKLINKADEFMIFKQYDDAILLYKEILTEREDQYAKDRILEAEALRAKQQKEKEQLEKDEAIRLQAELVPSATNTNTISAYAVHFTGALMSDVSSLAQWTSEAFNIEDPYSDFLKPGRYSDIVRELKNSGAHTLDGIAIPEKTRLIIYENSDFTGAVLLDVTGPAIVNNSYRYGDKRFKHISSKLFHDSLQSRFPQSVRSWSTSNMHTWQKGSMEIKTEGVE